MPSSEISSCTSAQVTIVAPIPATPPISTGRRIQARAPVSEAVIAARIRTASRPSRKTTIAASVTTVPRLILTSPSCCWAIPNCVRALPTAGLTSSPSSIAPSTPHIAASSAGAAWRSCAEQRVRLEPGRRRGRAVRRLRAVERGADVLVPKGAWAGGISYLRDLVGHVAASGHGRNSFLVASSVFASFVSRRRGRRQVDHAHLGAQPRGERRVVRAHRLRVGRREVVLQRRRARRSGHEQREQQRQRCGADHPPSASEICASGLASAATSTESCLRSASSTVS